MAATSRCSQRTTLARWRGASSSSSSSSRWAAALRLAIKRDTDFFREYMLCLYGHICMWKRNGWLFANALMFSNGLGRGYLFAGSAFLCWESFYKCVIFCLFRFYIEYCRFCCKNQFSEQFSGHRGWLLRNTIRQNCPCAIYDSGSISRARVCIYTLSRCETFQISRGWPAKFINKFDKQDIVRKIDTGILSRERVTWKSTAAKLLERRVCGRTSFHVPTTSFLARFISRILLGRSAGKKGGGEAIWCNVAVDLAERGCVYWNKFDFVIRISRFFGRYSYVYGCLKRERK